MGYSLSRGRGVVRVILRLAVITEHRLVTDMRRHRHAQHIAPCDQSSRTKTGAECRRDAVTRCDEGEGSALRWFKSYLTSRCFRVKCETDLSSRYTSSCGVPHLHLLFAAHCRTVTLWIYNFFIVYDCIVVTTGMHQCFVHVHVIYFCTFFCFFLHFSVSRLCFLYGQPATMG